MFRNIKSKLFGLKHYKIFVFLFCIVLAFVVVLEGTLAWFKTSDSQTNSIENPQSNFFITAVDVFDPIPDGNGIIHKRVGAVNTREKPGFVRLLVIPVFIVEADEPGQPPLLLPAKIGEQIIIEDLNTTDLDSENDWIDGEDGYFYYLHILAPGESTDTLGTNLFNKVRLADGVDEIYKTANLYIEVKCEAVGTHPSGEYVNSWWNGEEPVSGPLKDVHDALKDLD